MKIKCLRDCSVFVQDREVVGYKKDEEFTIRKDSKLAERLKHNRNFEILDKPEKSPEEGPDEDQETDSEGDK